ncbi:MAG: agmatine deiminase family protein [Rickettsiales bacterium]|nr:agmatine deiminase family protein [Rickettsiales bacterium]
MYKMPAEWELHTATWLAWPHNKEDWPDKFAPIPWVYAEIIRNLAQVERVRLVVKNDAHKTEAKSILKRAGVNLKQVDFYIIPTDRVWLRDSGPIFVRDAKNRLAMMDWRFNAWAKYSNHKKDDKVPEQIGAYFKKHARIQPMHKGKRVVLEGGSIDVNGKGTLITTEECLLSKIQERNPDFKRDDYEAVFEHYLGITNIIWLGNGIVGDDTHGHVDDITRFVNANTIVTVVEKNTKDDNHVLLKENVKRLKAARDQNGKPFNIIELPMPKPVVFEGQRLPASYANFLIANGMVLVPTFNDANDRVALNILAEALPKHTIVPIHSVDLVWGLGTIHCMSQQEPA